VIAIAAGVTFYVLLAIFPGIAALVAIYGLVADPSTIGQHLSDLSGVLPGGATDILGDQLQSLTSQPPGSSGSPCRLGWRVSLWSANAGMKALFDALNVVYGEEEKRSFLKLNALSLAFTLGALLFMVFALAAIAVPGRDELPGPLERDRMACDPGQVADPRDLCRTRRLPCLSLRTQPREASMEVGDLGKRGGRHCLAVNVHPVLVVRGSFRQL
jgi:hypothetical protein